MALSPTLSQGLTRYGIGEAIRTLRLKKKMGLVELGRHSGLSPALLSKIERGKLFPTLPTLLRIALVFSVGLEYFFAGGRERRAVGVVRKPARRRFPESPDVKDPMYHFESLDYEAVERKMNAYLVEFHPVKTPKPRTHAHEGAEFIFVLDGSLDLVIGNEQLTLEKEDSVYFDASRAHAYRRNGSRPCRAVVVTTPA